MFSFNPFTANLDKVIKNVSTALSAGTVTATTYGITSDGGVDDIVLPEADTNNAGLLGADKWDEIVAAYSHSQLTSGNPHSVTLADVGGTTDHTGLSNIGMNTHGAIDTFIASKGIASGLAELDAGGLVPSSQLPSYVDDVLEYADLASFPVTGETGKIYIALDTNLTYRWSGSVYVEISASLALGETSSTAYRGDRGALAYTHISSDGSDHSFIDQDVQTTASPTHANLYVPDGGFMGILGADGWTFDSTNGDVSTMSDVGIGTTSPIKKLGVAGRIGLVSDGASPLSVDFYDGSSEANEVGNFFFANAAGNYLSDATAGDMGFRAMGGNFLIGAGSTIASEPPTRMIITTDGNVGIGTTSPASKLEVNGGVNIGGAGAIADNNLYVTNNCSALSFTDRTPFYKGDALTEISQIKGKDGKIDHSTLPIFAQKELQQGLVVDGKQQYEKDKPVMETIVGRDLGAMISIHTVGIQQLTQRIIELETEIELLKNK